MDIVKDSLVKDGKLIVHIGREDIDGTRFFLLTPETAVEVRKLIDEFLALQVLSVAQRPSKSQGPVRDRCDAPNR